MHVCVITEDANFIAKPSAVWEGFFGLKRSGYVWQLAALQGWHEAFSVVFPGVGSGVELRPTVAVSSKCPCSDRRDLRLARRKCCLAEKGGWLFLVF